MSGDIPIDNPAVRTYWIAELAKHGIDPFPPDPPVGADALADDDVY